MFGAPTNRQSLSAITILAVDDDRAVLGLIDQTLKSAGYQVLLADSGRGALEAYERFGSPIQLLVADVIMPDLTGPVVAQRLRSRQPELPVLFISGFHDADIVQRFVTDKGFTLLPKPFTIGALLRVVQESLGLVPR
jgi:two-component system cell cycle sensor histidine kinase/response regulator CckA